jgi:hypothetical protein
MASAHYLPQPSGHGSRQTSFVFERSHLAFQIMLVFFQLLSLVFKIGEKRLGVGSIANLDTIGLPDLAFSSSSEFHCPPQQFESLICLARSRQYASPRFCSWKC